VIPNGIDTAYFSYRAEAASQLRRQWKIPATAPLIGLVARLDPVKDHWTFLVAASMLLRHRPEVHFVCVGSGLSEYAQKLESFASELGIQEHVHWTGTMNDMPAVYSALDLNTLCTAFGEGFPNSVAEAMSCGIPCVVTPAGDSARIVGETGLVVDARSAEGLAKAWRQLLELSTEERTALKNNARERIVSNFPIELMIRRTEQALISVEGLAA
jgi:glycosyltransferase involved in cell wall biosynthesis